MTTISFKTMGTPSRTTIPSRSTLRGGGGGGGAGAGGSRGRAYSYDSNDGDNSGSNNNKAIIILGITGLLIVLWNITLLISAYKTESHHNNIIQNAAVLQQQQQQQQIMSDNNNAGTNEDDNNNLTYFRTTLSNFPEPRIDIWPDRHYYYYPTALLDHLYSDCLPNENADCQIRTNNSNNNNQQVIAILRTPGVIGEIFEEFVVEYIKRSSNTNNNNNNNNNNNHFTIIKTSHIDPDAYEQYSKVIRPAILPMLLEAIDLAIRTTDNDDNNNNSNNNVLLNEEDLTLFIKGSTISIDDISSIIRQILRWNSRITNVIGKDTALLTIPFDRILAYPKEVQNELSIFIYGNNNNNNSKQNGKQQQSHYVQDIMDQLAEKLVHRIDLCNTILLRIVQEYIITTTNNNKNNNNNEITNNNIIVGNNMQTILDPIIQEELNDIMMMIQQQNNPVHDNDNKNKNNKGVLKPLRGLPIIQSRVTDIIGHYLDRNPTLSSKICRKYIHSKMCLYDTKGQIQV